MSKFWGGEGAFLAWAFCPATFPPATARLHARAVAFGKGGGRRCSVFDGWLAYVCDGYCRAEVSKKEKLLPPGGGGGCEEMDDKDDGEKTWRLG